MSMQLHLNSGGETHFWCLVELLKHTCMHTHKRTVTQMISSYKLQLYEETVYFSISERSQGAYF